MKDKGILYCFTDGASRGNPGLGAYAYVFTTGKERYRIKKYVAVDNTTNNRMELTAIISLFETFINSENYISDIKEINIYTDSKYAITVYNNIAGWAFNNFEGKKNVDLLKRFLICHYYLMNCMITIKLIKVKGHSNDGDQKQFEKDGNDYVDKLCNLAMDSYKR